MRNEHRVWILKPPFAHNQEVKPSTATWPNKLVGNIAKRVKVPFLWQPYDHNRVI